MHRCQTSSFYVTFLYTLVYMSSLLSQGYTLPVPMVVMLVTPATTDCSDVRCLYLAPYIVRHQAGKEKLAGGTYLYCI